MTPDQIKKWADEAGFGGGHAEAAATLFTRFTQLVASHKQEQCAKVCREVRAASGGDQYDMFGNDLAEQCETAIKALED